MVDASLIEIGYSFLVKHYALNVIPHYRVSYITKTGRGSTSMNHNQEIVIYPHTYVLSDLNNPLEHLEFAIKHEGIHLEIISQFFSKSNAETITQYIKKTPTGKYCRMIWFLYEFLTEFQLNIPNVKDVPYVDLLDPKKHYVGISEKSRRHAVNNNLLGTKEYCPFARKTTLLKKYERKNFSLMTKKLMNTVDAAVLARATNYLYTKETKSSFGIEKVNPGVKRTAQFIALLESAASIQQLDKQMLIMLQNSIVDDAYRDTDYRSTQNYVGELTHLYTHQVHYISPKPSDLSSLMEGFLNSEKKLFQSGVHPVVIAAILSFGFVFLHPFEDGNGRIHRFLIHYVLSKKEFTPLGIIFPISAVMLQSMRKYDETLESFSIPLLKTIGEYFLSDDGELTVTSATKQHYQYSDFTRFAEYLFECIELTLSEYFQRELNFIVCYDKTKLAIQHIVDMPDIKIDRIIRCIAQNQGVLGTKMRRTYFQELSTDKINAIEQIVKKEMSIIK
jgi:hypothetical protein